MRLASIVIYALVVVLGPSTHLAAAQSPSEDLRALAALVAAERQRIAELEGELARRRAALDEISARVDALAGTAPASPSTPRTPAPAPEPPRFNFYGEATFRFDSFNHGFDACAICPVRNRGRFRMRFGTEGRLAPGLRVVMGLGVGELNDPSTVYQSLGGNFARKVATWDRAYLSWRPQRAQWMDLTAGKFPYTWLRSSMTFDVDLYPEGLSERFSFDLKRAGPLSNVTLHGLQLIVNEQARAPDTLFVGGQASATVAVSPRVSTRIAAMGMDVRNPEHLLRAQLNGTHAGTRNANTIVFENGEAFYATGFRYANLIVENAVRTRWEAMPMVVTLEFHRNLRAISGRRDGRSFRIEAGRQLRAGDWSLGWHVFRLEQDAIVTALGESDWRSASNVLQHRFAIVRTLHPNVLGAFTWYRGRTLDRNLPGAIVIGGLPPGGREPWANLLDFDVIYRF